MDLPTPIPSLSLPHLICLIQSRAILMVLKSVWWQVRVSLLLDFSDHWGGTVYFFHWSLTLSGCLVGMSAKHEQMQDFFDQVGGTRPLWNLGLYRIYDFSLDLEE